jgi:dienelactone hydrolase
MQGIEGFTPFTHTDAAGRSYPVFRSGSGPPVIIIHEIFGISPMLVDFAERVIEREFSVYLPALIPRRRGPLGPLLSTIQVCISAEFVKLARGKRSPIVDWLRSLSEKLHKESDGRVGVVGMCLTGGFALAMAVDDYIAGPVMAHPALPFGIGSRRRSDLGLSREQLTAIQNRADLRILGVRFSSDLIAPAPRFARMEAEFGERFTRTELPSGCRSPLGLPPWEHSVLASPRLRSTKPKDARARAELERVVDEVLDFLNTQLAQDVRPDSSRSEVSLSDPPA